MYTQRVAMALAPLFLLARADMQLDSDDVPSACTAICGPIVELTRRCEVDLRGDNNDRAENQLEAQCVCTNDSFSVSSIASTCAACIHANRNTPTNDNDDDSWDTRDIDDILYTCGWSRGSWSTAAATQASGITVQATAPTASSQLTTTIIPGATNTDAASTGTRASASGSQSATSTTSTSTSTSTSTRTSTRTGSSNDNGASSLAPMGVAGAAIAFAALMVV